MRRPVDYDSPLDPVDAGVDSWPGAPPGDHVADFDRFIGDDPNGTWSLRVVDDTGAVNSGKINEGWTLTIASQVPDALVPGTPGQGGVAKPYWTTRTVSGESGVVKDVDVSLSGVHHERPSDIDLLLVGPGGQRVMLMSDTCGATAKGANWGWDDQAGGEMPADACPSNTAYKPTDRDPTDTLPAPAPARPYAGGLSAFDHTDPNGEWRLYAFDDRPAADGYFVERFRLDIETRPRANVSFMQAAVELVEGQTGELTLARNSGGQGLGEGAVTVISTPLSASSGSDFEPISTTLAFAPGQEEAVPIRALADSLPEGAETFAVQIGLPSGDGEPAEPSAAEVTIHDPGAGPAGDPGPVGDPLPGGGGGGAGADRDAPVIGRVTLSPTAFAVARRATARLVARGTRIRYTLSEPAAVTLRFQRAATGRRLGRSCRRVTTRNRGGRPCRRYVAAGTCAALAAPVPTGSPSAAASAADRCGPGPTAWSSQRSTPPATDRRPARGRSGSSAERQAHAHTTPQEQPRGERNGIRGNEGKQSVVWGLGPYERISEHLAIAHDHLLAEVEPCAGERWLDVATGTDEIAVRAAAAGASVIGQDLATAS